ncbi:tudor domain-containing protein 7B-like [Pomacea canaliculata]|uniref:tudor domain-containing protein 7B-like n=1 Tax=Pomacea canaliculata TaxID=400727 RepID=UPI000D72D350|nr:tudor domain-containing protein 7B-like [Pomacea canaliculata]
MQLLTSNYFRDLYDGQCDVEIFKEDTGDFSLNQYLLEAKLADTYLVPMRNAGVSEAEEEPAELELPAEDFVEVIVAYVDFNSCTVRLVGKKFSDRLEEFEDNLATLYKSAAKDPPLKAGSVCIASADLLYHRVKITELEGQKANCFFVDHGYTEWFYLDQLRLLDPKINKQVPYQAIPCILAGLENFMKLPTAMTELIERSRNKICAAEVISSGLEGNVETVLSTIENLSLNVESSGGAGDAGGKAELPVTKLLYTWGLPQVPEADPSKSDSSTSAVTQDSVINKTSSNSSVTTISVPTYSTTKSTLTTSKLNEEHQQLPMPGLMPLPDCEKFFCVYVHKIYDPYNFVVISHDVYPQLEEMMASMNMKATNMGDSGDASQQQKASVVKNPLIDNLYMARLGNVLYRAIFVDTIEGQYYLYFPDYCMYDVVSPDALFALPSLYWSLPFAACKARLHGVKPKKETWSEEALLRFTQLVEGHVLVALLKAVEPVMEADSSSVHKTRRRVVSISLVDTSDPDEDVVVSDQLISCELAVADS